MPQNAFAAYGPRWEAYSAPPDPCRHTTLQKLKVAVSDKLNGMM